MQGVDNKVVSDPRACLKAATQNVHQALHQHPVSLAILHRGCVPALIDFLAAQQMLWHLLQANIPPTFAKDFASLHGALCRDTGLTPMPASAHAMDRATIAGTTYVALGSLMGRKSLQTAMRRHGQARFPSQFLSCPMPLAWWQWTMSELDVLARNPIRWARVIAAAHDGFATIHAGLDARANSARHMPQ